MYNYSNLNDVEFELLCQDIMSKKLGIPLRAFARGRDGGVDLSDYDRKSNIIVQVKHYVLSANSSLISNLKKEVPKVKKLSPKQHYVCCSKELSRDKINEIYDLFKDYMKSPENVLTLKEINHFLEDPTNSDVLNKHFKLWLSSTSVLTNLFNSNILLDCDYLMADIENETKLFVDTIAFEQAKECLKTNRCLLVTGDPGVGKTITCKMLVLYFISEGYKVRYTTDGTNLSDLKKSLSLSKDEKEIILLDDCLGQAYFKMKETQENELLSIINHVKLYKNKILLMNSRVTIYDEAISRTPDLLKVFNTKHCKVHILDMNKTTILEKAKILYNHLYFSPISKDYFEDIKKDKRYLDIVKHANYNPRIIDYVTNKDVIMHVKPDDYFSYVMSKLNNPEDVWENEYTYRLNVIDRLFISTLYSLTDTFVSEELFKKCFFQRISNERSIDLTIDNFNSCLKRLENAFVKVVSILGKRYISVANPSINDFLRSYLDKNTNEKATIIKNAKNITQINRLCTKSEYDQIIFTLFETRKILDFEFESLTDKNSFISLYVGKYFIKELAYSNNLFNFLSNPDALYINDEEYDISTILEGLLKEDLANFYKIKEFLNKDNNLSGLLSCYEVNDLIEIIALLDNFIESKNRDKFVSDCEIALGIAADDYVSQTDISSLGLDLKDAIEDSTEIVDGGHSVIDEDHAIEIIEMQAADIISDEIYDLALKLPMDIDKNFLDSSQLISNINGAQNLVNSYLKPDDDYDYDFEYHSSSNNEISEVEYIFEREFK